MATGDGHTVFKSMATGEGHTQYKTMATGEGQSEEIFEFLCSVCRKKKKNTEADKFCSDCVDYYCKVCVRFHEEIPVLSKHTIIDRAKCTPGTSTTFPVVPTDRCQFHPHKTVDMFCKQHDKVGCSKCMKTYHSACDKVYVADYVRSNFHDNSEDAERKLISIAESVNHLIKTFITEKDELTANMEDLVKKTTKLREEINQRLDELEKNTLQGFNSKLQTMIDNAEQKITELQAAIRQVESAQDSLNSVGSNQSQLFVSMKKAAEVVNNAEVVVRAAENKISATVLIFEPDAKLLTLLYEMQNLGKIIEKQKFQLNRPDDKRTEQSRQTSADTSQQTSTFLSKYQSLPTRASQGDQRSSESNHSSVLKIKGVRKNNLRLSDGSSIFDITGICLLEDGTIIIADNCKLSLRHLDSFTFTVISSCVLSCYMTDVCAISKQEVAVTCFATEESDHCIQFVVVGKCSMKKTKKINTSMICRGTAYRNSTLYVSSESSLYTVSGNKLQEFSQDQQSGQVQFTYIQRLAISTDNSKIYIADLLKGLIILDINGKLVGQFKPPELGKAQDICLCKNGNVLVCGRSSLYTNILQFSADGKLIGEVLKLNHEPSRICLNQTNSQLIIVHKHFSEIEIYDIVL